MPLTDTQLKYYDSNVLRLPADKRKEYHEQADRLISELNKTLATQHELEIKRVVKAGSFAKFTILRKTSDDPVDVDVVIYISGKDVNSETLENITKLIYDRLIELYPSKAIEDFEMQRKAATVTFVGTGLSIDLVPVLQDGGREGYGWQFDIQDGTKTQTCAPCQIKFVRDRKNKDSDFRTLVRLAKRWRNHAELKPLKSFTIELILAHLLDKGGNEGAIESKFRQFLLYIAQSGLKTTITFPENGPLTKLFTSPVVIIDPVCDSNNVTSRITEAERIEIVSAASAAWEVANFASAENDTEVWKEIFGPRFKIKD